MTLEVRTFRILLPYFFNKSYIISIRVLNDFQFRRKALREDGKLDEVDFAEMLLAYAGYPAKKKARMIKRIKKELSLFI